MIKVEEHKLPQHNLKVEKFLHPKRLYLPLSQHIGAPSIPVVKVKEKVEEGQIIAKPGGKVSAYLHSPCQGCVVDIDNFNHPVLKRTKTIILECNEGEKKYTLNKKIKIDELNKEKLIEIIKEKGILGMGGAGFPTYIKLSPPRPIESLIVNGCECEPYLSCDYRLMVENIEGIFRGVEIIAKILQPKEVFFCVEDNKLEAIKKINLFLSLKKVNLPQPQIVVLKSYYPQGGEKQLIYRIKGKKVGPGKLPYDVGCIVHNVATCFAIYEAVYLDKPLIERIVTFAGDSLRHPKNVLVKIGTTVRQLIESKFLEFEKEPVRIVMGGPMMGIAVDSLDYPILKVTSGVLFLSKDKIDLHREETCIRCGRCVDACPLNLLPLEFVKKVKKGEPDKLNQLYIKDCIECGCCSFVCPAKIPIVHYIKVGKLYVNS